MQRVAKEQFLHKETRPNHGPRHPLWQVLSWQMKTLLIFSTVSSKGILRKQKNQDLKNFQYFFNLHNIL